MQEHRSNDTKNAVVTPLMNHIATPSSFPNPPAVEPPCVEDDEGWTALDSTLFDRRLKKPELLVVLEAVDAMNFGYESLEVEPQNERDLAKVEGCPFKDIKRLELLLLLNYYYYNKMSNSCICPLSLVELQVCLIEWEEVIITDSRECL